MMQLLSTFYSVTYNVVVKLNMSLEFAVLTDTVQWADRPREDCRRWIWYYLLCTTSTLGHGCLQATENFNHQRQIKVSL